MFRFLASLAIVSFPLLAVGQLDSASGGVRVTVSQNADGSRSTYEFNDENHTALATTKGRDGKLREKIRYVLDEFGRFKSGEIFGTNNDFRYKALYKYNAAGQIVEEAHVTRQEALINTIVFRYDAAGKQTGYSVLDANGKVVGETSPVRTSGSPARQRR